MSLIMMQKKRGNAVQQRERVQPLINSFFTSKIPINNYAKKENKKKVKQKHCTCIQTLSPLSHTQTHTNTRRCQYAQSRIPCVSINTR